MTEQDRKVSSHLEKRNHMQNPELSSEVFTDRKQRHSPRDRLLSISFPLTYTNYLFSQKKKKKKVCPSQWFSLIPVLQSRLYWIPRGHCGCCSLTHVLCSQFTALRALLPSSAATDSFQTTGCAHKRCASLPTQAGQSMSFIPQSSPPFHGD